MDNLLRIFLTGGTGGVGSAVKELMSARYDIVSPSRQQLDMSDLSSIDKLDLSSFDILIHCAASNPGAYLGWHDNSWQNQRQQIDINLTAGLLLLKQYTKQRTTGQFVYVTSTNIDDPWPQNMFYTVSKYGMRVAVDSAKRKYTGIIFTEICPGKIRTNMLEQNYLGTRSPEEIQKEYDSQPCLDPKKVADMIDFAVQHKLDKITITSHEKYQKN